MDPQELGHAMGARVPRENRPVPAPGQLVVHVELREEIKGAEAPAFWVKVRHGLNELRAQKLPPIGAN